MFLVVTRIPRSEVNPPMSNSSRRLWNRTLVLPLGVLGGISLGALSGCGMTHDRYLELRGRAPSVNAYPYLAPSSTTRAALRVAGGVPTTTNPTANAPHGTADLSLPPWDGQVDGFLAIGPNGLVGTRYWPGSVDLFVGAHGHSGALQILGVGGVGMREFRLDRVVERTLNPVGINPDEVFVDTIALSSSTVSFVGSLSISCLANLPDSRVQPFLAASLQFGPRLSGDSGNTGDSGAISFGSAAFDAGIRTPITDHFAATLGIGYLRGTGVFDDGWGRGFAALEWRIPEVRVSVWSTWIASPWGGDSPTEVP